MAAFACGSVVLCIFMDYDLRNHSFGLPLAQRAPQLRKFGSMVLFFICRSIFRPAGRKIDLQRL